MLPTYSHGKQFGILTHLREEQFEGDFGYYHSSPKHKKIHDTIDEDENIHEAFEAIMGDMDEEAFNGEESLEHTLALDEDSFSEHFLTTIKNVNISCYTHTPTHLSFIQSVIHFFYKIKFKLFCQKKLEGDTSLVAHSIDNSIELDNLFEHIRSQLINIQQSCVQNQYMQDLINQLLNLVENMQKHLDILLNSTHSIHIELKQDAKSMMDLALPQLFSSYFSSLIKASDKEKINHTTLFMATMVKLEEKFCLLAKDVVEFEKEQRMLSLSETLQFVENRFLQEGKAQHTLTSHL